MAIHNKIKQKGGGTSLSNCTHYQTHLSPTVLTTKLTSLQLYSLPNSPFSNCTHYQTHLSLQLYSLPNSPLSLTVLTTKLTSLYLFSLPNSPLSNCTHYQTHLSPTVLTTKLTSLQPLATTLLTDITLLSLFTTNTLPYTNSILGLQALFFILEP
jgi:hypothetical protein